MTSLSIIDVDNSTGWPWYAANLPPTDFYDCLFIFYSCTDFEEPGLRLKLSIETLSIALKNQIVLQLGPTTKRNVQSCLITA